MNCTETREALLTAERAELKDGGSGALAQHLAACDECARLARIIEVETAALARLVAARPLAPAILHGRWSVRRVAPWILLPLAAALVGVIVSRRNPNEVSRDSSATVASNGVVVDAGTNQRATIIKSQDPNITIVWLTPKGTE